MGAVHTQTNTMEENQSSSNISHRRVLTPLKPIQKDKIQNTDENVSLKNMSVGLKIKNGGKLQF